MKNEDQLRNAILKEQLAKICEQNPNAIPVYLIISNHKDTQIPEIPIKFYAKQFLLKELVLNLNQKYQQYSYVYLFGKENIDHQEEMSLKQKRKLALGQVHSHCSHESKVIPINKQNQNMTISEMHDRYQDNNNLLVVVISQKPLIAKQKSKYYDWIFIGLAVICAGLYLTLSLSQNTISQGTTSNSL